MRTRSATCSFAAALMLAVTSLPSPSIALPTNEDPAAEEKAAPKSTPRIPLGSMMPGSTATGTEDLDNADDAASTEPDDSTPPPILRDLSLLPEPVQRMRRLIMEAARSGDINRFRPLLGSPENGTQLSFAEQPEDQVDFLRSMSGDEKGYEVMAIILEVLEAPFVQLSPGTDEELYVWPYFAAMPLQSLTPEQMVELMTLVTAGDYEAMEEFGAYNFFRIGISPDGEWVFFVAGD